MFVTHSFSENVLCQQCRGLSVFVICFRPVDVTSCTFLWTCFFLEEEDLTLSTNMNACCLSSTPGEFLQGFFPIYDTMYCPSCAHSPALSISLICVLTCRHFLIIPILISATVNEWRDSSCRVWAFGLMWALLSGSLGIVCTFTVHYCGYLTF